MELPHYDLIYDAKHQELANIYADRLEDNVSFLKEYFEVFPERTVVVLNDRTDLTNGYATPLPYRTIMLFPVLPGPMETISDYGDWARELSMHEFTHVLSFEPRRGIVKGLYYTFGNIITPNLLLPRWWLEGIAVDMETRTSERGRLRSPYQDASIRAYLLSEKLEDVELGEINETGIHTWPQGGRPYLFGSLMWSELIGRYGKDKIKELHWRYGGRFPFFIEGPMKDETGVSYNGLFRQMKDSLESRVEGQIATLKKTNLSSGTNLSLKNAEETFSPVISPDGLKMVLLAKDDTTKRAVRVLRRASVNLPFEGASEVDQLNQKVDESLNDVSPSPVPRLGSGPFRGIDEGDHQDGPPGGSINRLSWFPNSQKFVFDKLGELNRFHEVADLWIYDFETEKSEQITTGARAREGSVSPDGQRIAFVKLDAGTTHLGILDLNSKQIQVLDPVTVGEKIQPQRRISYPTFISNNEVIFSDRVNGNEHLWKMDLSTGQAVAVLPDYPNARLAQMTPLGLTFVSSKNGTSNVYVASKDLKTAKPITHTGTFMAASTYDSHRKELYSTELTTEGFQVRRFDQAQTESLPSQLPVIEGLMADRYPSVQREIPVVQKPEAEEYSAWPYIFPRYWLPSLYFTENNSLVGLSTAGSDPLGKHTYALAAAYESQPKETSLNFQYLNSQTSAQVYLKAFDYRTNIINTGTRYRQQRYEVDSLWQVSPISHDLFAGLGWVWTAKTFSGSRSEAQGPTAILQYLDYAMNGAQISPESGEAVNFSTTSYLKNDALENEDFQVYNLAVQKYFSKWLPRHHAMMFRLQGQFIDKDVSATNAAFTVPYATFANAPSPYFIMRGYLNGQFLGKTLYNGTAEYRFPIAYWYRGAGTSPLFIRRLHAAAIADGVMVDGFSYNKELSAYERVEKSQSFWTVGAELKADVTLGYHFPFTFFMGYYQPTDTKYKDGDRFAIGLQL